MDTENQSRKLSRIAIFLKKKIDNHPKNQKEIAREMGFSNPNFLSMIKRGDAKVPIDKVVIMAKALSVDPAYLMRLALEQIFPNQLDEVWEVFDRIMSSNELALIRAVRIAYAEDDPTFTMTQIEEAVALLAHLHPPRRAKAPSG